MDSNEDNIYEHEPVLQSSCAKVCHATGPYECTMTDYPIVKNIALLVRRPISRYLHTRITD